MLRIAVHLHMFYTDQWPTMRGLLGHMGGYPFDLYVTLNKPEAALQTEIVSTFTGAHVEVLENRGYDIGPFIWFLHQIELRDYDVIIKLHTKSVGKEIFTRLNGYDISRHYWQHLLYSSVLGSEQRFRYVLNLFEENERLGMVGSRSLVCRQSDLGDKEMLAAVQNEMRAMHLPADTPIEFVAGTVFAVRSSLLAPLREHFDFDSFSVTDPTVKDGTPAHRMERLFGAVVCAQGYSIGRLPEDPKVRIRMMLKSIWYAVLRKMYRNKVTKSGKRIIKVLSIPVYYGKR